MLNRRFLPSLSQLLAFEAVVRHGSVTQAAKELDLTQSTVSRLIQNLEAQLGRELFVRRGKKLLPTGTAETYFRNVSHALSLIHRASMGVVANPQGGILSLATLPTFGTRWLGPKPRRFPDRQSRRDGQSRDAGAALRLRHGTLRRGDLRRARLAEGLAHEAVRRAADRLRLGGFPGAPSDPRVLDLAGLPLLQLETRPTAWPVWFKSQGGFLPATTGMLMDQFSMMIQAAISVPRDRPAARLSGAGGNRRGALAAGAADRRARHRQLLARLAGGRQPQRPAARLYKMGRRLAGRMSRQDFA